jgi:two-component system, NarL family, sensor kinase
VSASPTALGSASDAAERRLIRLAYDLHDGPLQELAALTSDLRLFRLQLASALPSEQRSLLLGRVDDLDARLGCLEGELREFAVALEPRSLVEKPFTEALLDEAKAFSDAGEAKLRLELEGAFDALTASQRIALLRVAREALTNARSHSGATEVVLSVVETSRQVRLRIADNGRGFTVEPMVARAARAGRLGLLGMSDRIRLLGGTFRLRSRPGGPTVVSATIPRWSPADRAA